MSYSGWTRTGFMAYDGAKIQSQSLVLPRFRFHPPPVRMWHRGSTGRAARARRLWRKWISSCRRV